MATLMEILDRPESAQQMKRIDNVVATTVKPFRGTTETAIIVFALVRVARMLLNLYPPNVQKELLQDVIVPFLHGEHREEGLIIQ
jgi:hypothetical protein